MKITGSLLGEKLSCCDWFGLQSVEKLWPSLNGTCTHVSHISGSTAQYLNVRQRKLGTIVIQIVHILQHHSATAGSMLMEDFKHNPN